MHRNLLSAFISSLFPGTDYWVLACSTLWDKKDEIITKCLEFGKKLLIQRASLSPQLITELEFSIEAMKNELRSRLEKKLAE